MCGGCRRHACAGIDRHVDGMHLERDTPTCSYIHIDALTASATHRYTYLLPRGIHSNRQLAAAKHEHEHGILLQRVWTSLGIALKMCAVCSASHTPRPASEHVSSCVGACLLILVHPTHVSSCVRSLLILLHPTTISIRACLLIRLYPHPTIYVS